MQRDTFQLSFCQPCFQGEGLETSLKRLKRLGYDGVELSGDLAETVPVLELLKRYDLTCFSINGLYTEDRDLSSKDASVRSNAVTYCRTCIDTAAQLDAKVVIIVPTFIGKLGPETTVEAEWAHVVSGLKQVAEYAEDAGIWIVVESVNRYESYLVNRLGTQYELLREVDNPAVRMMGDLFHMNIEEADICESIKRYAPWLKHMHIADNHRRPIGMGSLPMKEIIQSLHQAGWDMPLTMEYDHLVPGTNGIISRVNEPEIYDRYAGVAAETIRRL